MAKSKKLLSLFICVIMLLSAIPLLPLSAESATASAATYDGASFTKDGNELKNKFLSIAMSTSYPGRYTIGTTGGNPDISTDDSKKMLYGWPDSGTTKTTLYVDGSTTVFGCSSSDITYDTTNGKIVCSTTYKGVKFTQTLSFVSKSDKNRLDCVEIKYDAKNVDSASHTVGLRIMLDTMLGGNDSAPFRVAGVGDVTTQKQYSGSSIPTYWEAFDSLSAPTVQSQGSFLVTNGNTPNTVQFTSWPDVTDVLWDCPVTAGSSNGDSAVTVKWSGKALPAGSSRAYMTYYGLAAITPPVKIDTAEIGLSAGLDVKVVRNQYSPNPVEYNLYLQNPGTASTGNISLDLGLDANTLLEPVDGLHYNIGKIAAGGSKTQTIKIKLHNSAVTKTETIKFKFTSSTGKTVTVTKTIKIPKLEIANSKIDLAFVIDTTGSMSDDIATVRSNMQKYITSLKQNNIDYRIAIVDYRDFPDRTGDSDDYAYRVQMNFSSNSTTIQNGINALSLGYGGDGPETVYSGLVDGLRSLSWRTASDVPAFAIVMGDADPLDPEPKTNYTLSYVLKALKGNRTTDSGKTVTPVINGKAITLYTLMTSGSPSTLFKNLANGSGGISVNGSSSSAVDSAIKDIIDKILVRTVIISHPKPVSQPAGTTAKFTVNPRGVNLKYQWQVSADGGRTWTNSSLPGYNTPTLSVPITAARNGYLYRCKVTGADGEIVYSDPAKLTVTSTLKITSQPKSFTGPIGSTAVFVVAATGSSLTYQWQVSSNNGSTWTNSSLTGNKTAVLSVPVTAARNGYKYRCKITSGTSTITSNAAVLKAKAVVTAQPKDVLQTIDSTAKFTVTASTVKTPTYQWQLSTDGGTTWKNSSMTGNKTKTLSVPVSSGRNGYLYRCKVTDVNGTVISNPTALKVKVKFITQPSHQIFVSSGSGKTAKFTVKASGIRLTYQWQVSMNHGETWKNSTLTGNKTATLSVPVSTDRNLHMYRCIVKDVNSTETSNAAYLVAIS